MTRYVILLIILSPFPFNHCDPHRLSTQNHDRISLHLPALGSENNFKIHEVTVDGVAAKFQERPRYLKRANKNFSDIADLHNFEVRSLLSPHL